MWQLGSDASFAIVGLLALFLASIADATVRSAPPGHRLFWIAICTVPFFGPFVYFVFGASYPRRDSATAAGSTRAKIDSVDLLLNGEEAYPAMLGAIAAAKSSVYLSTYQFDFDGAGEEFCVELENAVRRNVDVRVIIDGLGQLLVGRSIVRRLRGKRIPTRVFHPISALRRFNFRYHRKILVVDSEIAFIGGLNIREDHYVLTARDRPTADLHFRLDGEEIVKQLEAVVVADWNGMIDTSDAMISGAKPARSSLPDDSRVATIILSDPYTLTGTVREAFKEYILKAETIIDIVTPYFVPDKATHEVLRQAVARGVRINIVVPQINRPLIKWASLYALQRACGSGCNIYFSPAPHRHSKLLLVDRKIALVGSANWDYRSLWLSYEILLGFQLRDCRAEFELLAFIRATLSEGQRQEPASFGAVRTFARVRNWLAHSLRPLL